MTNNKKTPNNLNVELRPWFTLPEADQETYTSEISDNYDVTIADISEAHALRSYLWSTKLGFWAIFVEDNFAGWFALGEADSHPSYLHSSTFVLPEYRNKGISHQLKVASGQALYEANILYGMTVRSWNKPSIGAINNAFPGVKVEDLILPNGDLHHWFDVSMFSFDMSDWSPTTLSLYTQLSDWANKLQRVEITLTRYYPAANLEKVFSVNLD